MRRRLLFFLFILFTALLLLSACAREGTAEAQPSTVRHVVTFYEGGSAIYQCRVADGGYVHSVPEADGVWEDEEGGIVNPSEIAVTRDRRLRLRYVPVLAETSGVLLSGEGSCFLPDNALTRGETATLLCSLIAPAETERKPEESFVDISRYSPWADAVKTVSAYRLMTGYAEGTFRPRDAITRAEFTTALFRLSGLPGVTAEFEDVSADHWASEAIGCAAQQGWITGFDDGKFYPEAPLTRAQAAVILDRFLGAVLVPADIDIALEGRTPFVDVLPSHWAYYDIVELGYRNELLRYFLGEADGAEPGFVILDGKLCHVNEETLRLDRYEAGFQTIDGALYHVGEAGYFIDRMPAGLQELDGGMYYVPEEDGPFLTDGAFGYLTFGQDGRYTSGSELVDAAVEELLAGIIGNNSMSREERLYAGFLRVRDGGFFYRSVNAAWARGSVDWTLWAAEQMFTQRYGSCFYWAAAFLYTARRLGFQAYPVVGGVGSSNQLHAWVMVQFDDGVEYICDVELEWAYRHNFYNGPITMDSMFKQPLWATNAHYIFPSGMRTGDYGNWITYDYITYDDDLEEGEGDFLDIPEERQVPQTETDVDTETEETGDPAQPVTPGVEETGEEETTSGGDAGNTETEPVAPAVEPEPEPAEPEPAPADPAPAPADPTPAAPEPAPAEPEPPEPAPDGET